VVFYKKTKVAMPKALLILIGLLLSSSLGMAQGGMTLKQAESKLVQGNLSLKSASLRSQAAIGEQKGWLDLPKMNADFQYGETQFPGVSDYTFSIQQAMNWPGYYGSYKRLLQLQSDGAIRNQELLKMALMQQLRILWQQWNYQEQLRKLYVQEDSLFGKWAKTAQLRYQEGDIPKILAITANSRRGMISQKINALQADKKSLQAMVKILVGEDVNELGINDKRNNFVVLPDSLSGHPVFQLLENQARQAYNLVDLEHQKLLPELRVGYLNQSIEKQGGQQVLMAGVGIPLLSRGQQVRAQMAKVQAQAVEASSQQNRQSLQAEYQQAKQEYLKQQSQLQYYQTTALAEADEIQRYSWQTYQGGEIDFSDYLLSIEQSFRIREQYLASQLAWDRASIQLQYFLNPTE
jgi:cobalt-zinc-cadmium resistance protein CzcA